MTRPVMVFKWIQERDDLGCMKNKKVLRANGDFHQFGSEIEEYDNGAVNFCVAIVEFADGSVDTVHASLIQFTDKVATK